MPLRRQGVWVFLAACLLVAGYFGASRLGLLDRLQARLAPRAPSKLRLTAGDFPAGVAAPLGDVASIPLRPTRIGFIPRGSSAALLLACGEALHPDRPEAPPAAEGLVKTAYGLEARAVAYHRDEEVRAALARGGDHGGVDLAAIGVDRLAEWASGLRDAAPRALLLLGRSRGHEALAAVGPRTLAELRGKTVAVHRQSSAEYLALWLTARAGLAVEELRWLEVPTTAEAGRALREGKAEAAVGYAGDLEPAVRERGGAVLASTADAPHLVATVLVARGEFAARYPDAIRRLARGLLDAGFAVERGLSGSTDAARRLGEAAPYLGDPADAIRSAPPANLEDNLAFFGLAGEAPVTFGELFGSAGALYLKLGRTEQVPAAEEVSDLAALRSVAAALGQGVPAR